MDLRMAYSHLTLLEVKGKVMYVSTMNISDMVRDTGKITNAMK